MITGAQIRAARMLVKWTAADLSQRSGVGVLTIYRAETADATPNMLHKNMVAIRATLEDAGIIFLDSGDIIKGGRGVRMRR